MPTLVDASDPSHPKSVKLSLPPDDEPYHLTPLGRENGDPITQLSHLQRLVFLPPHSSTPVNVAPPVAFAQEAVDATVVRQREEQRLEDPWGSAVGPGPPDIVCCARERARRTAANLAQTLAAGRTPRPDLGCSPTQLCAVRLPITVSLRRECFCLGGENCQVRE